MNQYLILLLDVLGYSNKIKNCTNLKKEEEYTKSIYKIMYLLSNHIKIYSKIHKQAFYDACNIDLTKIQYITYSDNILFFIPYKNQEELINLFDNLIIALSQFLVQFQDKEILLRGAITTGHLYYKKTLPLIGGKGLITAYELEKKSKFPRILIDEKLNASKIQVGILTEKNKKEEITYLDYLSLGFVTLYNMEKNEKFLSFLKKEKLKIEKQIKNYSSDKKILQKYIWLANYQNNFLKKFQFPQEYKIKKET